MVLTKEVIQNNNLKDQKGIFLFMIIIHYNKIHYNKPSNNINKYLHFIHISRSDPLLNRPGLMKLNPLFLI